MGADRAEGEDAVTVDPAGSGQERDVQPAPGAAVADDTGHALPDADSPEAAVVTVQATAVAPDRAAVPLPASLRSRWPLVTARASVTLALGVVALVTPEITLATLLLVFGVFGVVEGVLLLVDAVRATGAQRPLLAVQGVIGAAAGLAALVWPSPSLDLAVGLVGAWAVASGVVEVAAGLAVARGVPSSYVPVLAGVASVTLGVLLFGRQDLELPGVAVLVGAFAFGAGSMLLASAMRLRQLPRSQVPS